MPFVAEQVRSILHQTLPPSELVVSDDASTDGTVSKVREIVDRFRAERPTSPLAFVVLKNPEPLGVTANFEQAVRACTGDLVALSDQDDVWMPDRLRAVVREFAARPRLTLLHSDARLVDEAGAPIAHTLAEAIEFTASEQRQEHEGNSFDLLLKRNVVAGATTVFRRELLAHAIPFPDTWVHDEWLAMIASVTGQVDFLPEQLIDYRQHSSNQIGARKPTLGDRLGRLQEPRIERNRRLTARAESLVDRLVELEEVPDRALQSARRKWEHEKARSALPASRIRRLIPVLRAAVAGRYRRFGRTRYDILRDLLQPAR